MACRGHELPEITCYGRSAFLQKSKVYLYSLETMFRHSGLLGQMLQIIVFLSWMW